MHCRLTYLIRLSSFVVLIGLIAIFFLPLSLSSAASQHHVQSRNKNPVKPTLQSTALGLDHYEGHCAVCHGATGKADTEKGKAVKAADLTARTVQSKSDDDLFNIISRGVDGTAMPGLGKTHSPIEIWQIILFLRRLREITPQERKSLDEAIPAGARHQTHEDQDESDEHKNHNDGQPMDQEPQHSGPPDHGASQTAEDQPHTGHDMSTMTPSSSQQMPGMHHGHNMPGMDMMASVAGGPFKTMAAIGSGTSLLPASSPGYMWHFMKDNWMLMLHGNLVAGVNHQGGPRGVTKAESLNWFMVMAEHPVGGGGALLLKGMFSGEPFTSPNGGFPELFQTGETWRGKPIIDAQHPHDLLMELSASLTMPISEFASVSIYGGPVAEPALGPVAFMHRTSASETPSAPLGHHWQDSTHISFGVVTVGANLWRFKIEGSVFNGREPDEDRKDIDFDKIDSWSGRVWFTPTRNWTLQYSHGHLKDPEALEPATVERNTASASYDRQWTSGWWATTLIWGRNHERQGNSNAYLFESTANFLNKNYLFTRLELVDKAGLLEENVFGRSGLDPLISTGSGFRPGARFDQAFRVGAFTVGGVRDIIATAKLRVGLGADITLHHVPRTLDQIYGSEPVSVQFWVRLKPGRMEH